MIRSVNKGNDKHVFVFSAYGPVRRGRGWPILPDGKDAGGYDFWFVFSEELCVGAVLRMDDHDLHAYVPPKHRRRGLMRRALTEWVFPHLAAEGKSEASVTLTTADGRALWLSVGGQLVDEDPTKGLLDLLPYQKPPAPSPELSALSASRREAIRADIKRAAQLLAYASDGLATARPCHATTPLRLDDLAAELMDAYFDLSPRFVDD